MKSLDELRRLFRNYCEDESVCRQYRDCQEHYLALIDAAEQEVAERYVALPVDADDVPWHLGDVTENGNTVTAMGLNAQGWCFVGTPNDIDPSIHRHYHAPTVEDVVTDLCEHVWEAALLGGTWSDSPVESYIADFAKRLRLAKEDE